MRNPQEGARADRARRRTATAGSTPAGESHRGGRPHAATAAGAAVSTDTTSGTEVADGQEHNISVTVWMLKPGQEKIVATRLREEFTRASV